MCCSTILGMTVQNLKIDFILASIKFLAQKVVPVYYNLNSVFQTNEMKRIILSIHCILRRYDIKSLQQRKIKFSILQLGYLTLHSLSLKIWGKKI